MGFGDPASTDPATIRGRDWPCLRQFCVFMENRVGCLHDMLRHVERDDLRVVALSIVDSSDHALARLVVDNYERAVELFQFSNLQVFETDVLAVELPETDQPHVSVCAALMKAEVNIHYTYPLIHRRGAMIVYVDDIDTALRVMHESGIKVVTERDLIDDEYFD